jgi:hypothetical protein
MIKKFITFINESIERIPVKTEYQIFHLNREERTKYLLQRLKDFKLNLTSYFKQNFDLDNKWGYNNSYFRDYEWDLCNKNIRQEYIKLCIIKGLGLSKYMLDDIDDENIKYSFLFKMIETDEIRRDEIFKSWEDSTKLFFIKNSKRGSISDEMFESCSEELRKVHIIRSLENKWGLSDLKFFYCSKDQKIFFIKYKLKEDPNLNNVCYRIQGWYKIYKNIYKL